MRWTTVAVAAGWAMALAGIGYVATIPAGTDRAVLPVVAAAALVNLTLATLLARRLPGRPQGPLLAAAGVVTIVTELPDNGALSGSWMLLYLPYALIVLVMPDGRFGSARWRRLGMSLAAVVLIFNLLNAVSWYLGVHPDDPSVGGVARDIADVLGVVGLALVLGFFVLLVGSVLSQIPRYRTAGPGGRLQLRWILLAGSTAPLTLLLCWLGYLLTGQPDLVVWGLLVMYLIIPAAVTVALLRPTWFDIDRATVAAVTTTVLSGLVLILVAVAGSLGPRVLTDSPALAIAMTAGLMVLMIPLYRLLGPAIGRLVYPERDRAVRALRRLRAEIDAGKTDPEMIEQVLQQALRDPGLRVILHSVTDRRPLTVDGAEVDHEFMIDSDLDRRSVAVRSRGDELGIIVGSQRRVKPPARAIAVAAAPVLDVVRLRTELARAVNEIAASRRRILIAGEDERRRLERDLHDGAQQRLIALGMRLRVLQRSGDTGTEVAAALDQVVAELGTAVSELRQLAHGIRPSALDDGLDAALAELAERAPGLVMVDVSVGALPQVVSATAYYVAAEAVANALKHAEATTIRVLAVRRGDSLRVIISDDGHGGADLSAGVGLAGIKERVITLGGRWTITSPIGRGTTVTATLRCGDPRSTPPPVTVPTPPALPTSRRDPSRSSGSGARAEV